jgi:ParE toxin of type II toxin-antitoxin system, parDE
LGKTPLQGRLPQPMVRRSWRRIIPGRGPLGRNRGYNTRTCRRVTVRPVCAFCAGGVDGGRRQTLAPERVLTRLWWLAQGRSAARREDAHGMHGVLRIRVAGDYRVLYTVDDDRLVVLVVDVGHRRPIYRANWPGGHKVLAPPSGGRRVAAKCARRLTLARPAGTMRRGMV